MLTQTIIKPIDGMSHMDNAGDFIQTEFDNEIESFITGLIEEEKQLMALNFMTCGNNLVCVIMYIEPTTEQKTMLRAQKSGLAVLGEKLKS